VRTADLTIIIITNFYLAADSHEIFLRVGGREGMKGIGAFQRHQLPHPLAKILHPPLARIEVSGATEPVLGVGLEIRTSSRFNSWSVRGWVATLGLFTPSCPCQQTVSVQFRPVDGNCLPLGR